MKCFPQAQGAGEQSRFLFQGHSWHYTLHIFCFWRGLADMLHTIRMLEHRGQRPHRQEEIHTHLCHFIMMFAWTLVCVCGTQVQLEEAACTVSRWEALAAGRTCHCLCKGALKWQPREGRQRERHKNINTFSRQYKYFLQATPALLGDALLSGVISRDSLASGKLRGLFRMGSQP